MLHKIDKNKKVAPKLIFFNENFFLERIEGSLMLKIDFENQVLALFDVYFWPFNKSRNKSIHFFFLRLIKWPKIAVKKPNFSDVLGTKVVQF